MPRVRSRPGYKSYSRTNTRRRRIALKIKRSKARRAALYRRSKVVVVKPKSRLSRKLRKKATYGRMLRRAMFQARNLKALQKPRTYNFRMSWLETKNISSPDSQVYNLKVVPGALFCPRMVYYNVGDSDHRLVSQAPSGNSAAGIPVMGITNLSQISGNVNSQKWINFQPAGYDMLDKIFSRASVHKSYMKVTIYSECTQPLIVAYATRTGALVGKPAPDILPNGQTSSNSYGTLDYVSNIKWSNEDRTETFTTSGGDTVTIPQLFTTSRYTASEGVADDLVNNQHPAYSYESPGGGSPYYNANLNSPCNPINLENNFKIKSFIWNQTEQQSGNRVKVIKFPVDHKKFVKNWKLRTAAMKFGQQSTDQPGAHTSEGDAGGMDPVGDDVVVNGVPASLQTDQEESYNDAIMEVYPKMSPVNYLHIGPFLPNPGDQESGASNLSHELSGLIRVKVELFMSAYLSGVCQELIDDADHNIVQDLQA
jgi:hypothetical protein